MKFGEKDGIGRAACNNLSRQRSVLSPPPNEGALQCGPSLQSQGFVSWQFHRLVGQCWPAKLIPTQGIIYSNNFQKYMQQSLAPEVMDQAIYFTITRCPARFIPIVRYFIFLLSQPQQICLTCPPRPRSSSSDSHSTDQDHFLLMSTLVSSRFFAAGHCPKRFTRSLMHW